MSRRQKMVNRRLLLVVCAIAFAVLWLCPSRNLSENNQPLLRTNDDFDVEASQFVTHKDCAPSPSYSSVIDLHRDIEVCMLPHDITGGLKGYPMEMQYVIDVVSLPQVKAVCELGFKGGYSAAIYLLANPNVTVYTFDLFDWSFKSWSLKLLTKLFPGRIFGFKGLVEETIPAFQQKHPDVKCNVIFVDTHAPSPISLDVLKSIASCQSFVFEDTAAETTPWCRRFTHKSGNRDIQLCVWDTLMENICKNEVNSLSIRRISTRFDEGLRHFTPIYHIRLEIPVSHGAPYWQIGMYHGSSWQTLVPVSNTQPSISCENVTDDYCRGIADPFLVRIDMNTNTPYVFDVSQSNHHREATTTWYMFMELAGGSHGGRIAYATSKDGLTWSYGGVVIHVDRHIHLSYPHAFFYGGHYYLVAQTNDENIPVWRTSPAFFPAGWEFVADIAPYASHWRDATLFAHAGVWYMLVLDQDKDELLLFWSTDVLGIYMLHPSSPIRTESKRPAGRVMSLQGHTYFFLQVQNSEIYGAGVDCYRVDLLTTTKFTFAHVHNILRGSQMIGSWNQVRMHHIDIHPWRTDTNGTILYLAATDGIGKDPVPVRLSS